MLDIRGMSVACNMQPRPPSAEVKSPDSPGVRDQRPNPTYQAVTLPNRFSFSLERLNELECNTMDDKKFQQRVPSLDQMNKTNKNLTQGGFDLGPEKPDEQGNSYFDSQGAARRRGIDDNEASGEKPGQ